ncbi:hypothetical protein BC936DRAFT_137627 [Jimgerdemannia flammicorona]|uniref:DNA-directed DNA polymerase n=2 Tax=Jimgerdemannia flammicorona TaxID=994334 RepID=A0A433DIZ2_9FUNG|nr:hypothetical protein BC936DRAFT_137627 [Jimgerdemannia flammicorona]RUS17508.1 hypothetical protein BC938DRAFT_476233 [Jimgerdemannia flammicorona]
MALRSKGMSTGMPIEYLDTIPRFMVNLDAFCGYVEATITIPPDMRPIIPLKVDGSLTFPTGTFKGLYYSESLRVLASLGYGVQCGKGYLFASADLFSNPYLDTEDNLLPDAAKALSNIAIGAAITAIARAIMAPYKADPNNLFLYSDTDSLFLPKPLDPTVIGPGLGQWKDELSGDRITHGIFIRKKAWAIKTYLEHNFYGDTLGREKVVIGGFPVASVSFDSLLSVLEDRSAMSIRQGSMTRTLKI